MLNTANIYIDLLNKIKESGGAVPPELVAEVEALDITVNGDETTEPPTVGLVDIVGDMGDVVEDLDIDINGDDTTEPPTPGLKDRVEDLETTINGDPTTTPETPGLVDRVGDLELSVNGDSESVPPILPNVGNVRMISLWSNPYPAQSFAAGDVVDNVGDYDFAVVCGGSASNAVMVVIRNGYKSVMEYISYSGNNLYFNRRIFEFNNGKVSCTNGQSMTQGSNITDDNNVLIPLYVYGIKLLY